ncbi:platelet-derived growth factor C [Nyctibius grandis]
MLLLGLLLLTSALSGRRQGAAAESDLSSKFAFSGAKEQNGKEQQLRRRSPGQGQGGGGRPAGAQRSSPAYRAARRRGGSAAPRGVVAGGVSGGGGKLRGRAGLSGARQLRVCALRSGERCGYEGSGQAAGREPGSGSEAACSAGGGVQDPQHEKVITVTTNGSIHSPKFPHTYPRNTVLVWRLVAVDENVWIQLTFDERFGLEDPEDDICKYDFVEVEEPSDGTVLGRWCGSSSVPSRQISKGNQIRIRFVSDEYFPSEPGFCIHYTLLMPHHTEAPSPSLLPPSALPLDVLNNAVAGFSTVEELIRYLEPDRWQLDLEDLYRPTWQLLGKAYIHGRKSRVVDLNLLKEEVRLYSCTPRNFSVSLREELKRTDTIFWPLCLLVKRCGGNCACCHQSCNECQCVPTKVTKKYHEVLQLKPRIGVRGLHKSLTDVPLEHHEECDCVCKGNTEG